MSAGKDELEELVETKSAQGALTPELSLLFIWRRVNEFKHRSFNISLPPTKSQFDADCTIHRCALSIAVSVELRLRWWQRNVARTVFKLVDRKSTRLYSSHTVISYA